MRPVLLCDLDGDLAVATAQGRPARVSVPDLRDVAAPAARLVA